MAFNVGELVAYLRLDMGDFERGMAKGQAQADKLNDKTVDVKVKADTAAAETKLAAVAAAGDRVGKSSGAAASGMKAAEGAAGRLADATAALSAAQARLSEIESAASPKTSTLLNARSALVKAEKELAAAQAEVDAETKKMADSGHKAAQGMGALANAIILLGPALVPVTVGVAGLTVGFGAMGAAGVLAIVGIKQQMADGTALGGRYTAMIATLQGDLKTLGATAAGGVLGPFQQAVADLQSRMPTLNSTIGEFSVMTGKAAGSVATGLVAAFLALEPLARDAGVYILALSDRFAAMMSGPGVVSFGTYVRSVFPQIMSAVTSVGDAVGHLVLAIAPLGMSSLGILQMFANLINAIPVNVLATLAQTASAVYIGISLFRLLQGPIQALSDAMLASAAAGRAWAVSTEVITAGIRGLTLAAGGIAAALSIGIMVYSAFAEQQRQNTEAANTYADALRASKGAIDDSIRATVAKNLADKGALDQANRLGISLAVVTDAAMGNAEAMARVKAVTDAATNITAPQASAAQQKLAGDANDLNATLNSQRQALERGIQSQKDYAAATTSTSSSMSDEDRAMAALAAKIGTTAAGLAIATAGQKTTADAAATAAAKMYLENDAAGILKSSLDKLNGKAINAAQAQNTFDSALANMGDHIDATGKKITFTTTNIGDMSSASVALRGQLNGQVADLEAVVEANGGLSDSTGKAHDQMVAMRKQIIDNAVAHGVDRDAVTAYIDKILKIPDTVPPTKVDVDKAAAEQKIKDFQALVNGIHGGSVTLTVTAAMDATVQAVLGAQRAGITLSHLPGNAVGGLITGPGTGTSDSILGVNAAGAPITRVSNGEFVVNAAATAKNRALLEAINSGQDTAGVGGVQGGGSVRLDQADMQALAQMTAAAATTIALSMSAGQSRTADNSRQIQGRTW